MVSKASKEELEELERIFSKHRNEKTEEEIEYIYSLIEKYKSIEYAKQKAKEFANKAKELFETFDFYKEGEAKQAIRLGIDFIINRDH